MDNKKITAEEKNQAAATATPADAQVNATHADTLAEATPDSTVLKDASSKGAQPDDASGATVNSQLAGGDARKGAAVLPDFFGDSNGAEKASAAAVVTNADTAHSAATVAEATGTASTSTDTASADADSAADAEANSTEGVLPEVLAAAAATEEADDKKIGRKKGSRLVLALVLLLSCFCLGVIAVSGMVMWANRSLQSYTDIADYLPPQVSTVYARDGSIIGYFYDEKRFLVKLSEMPAHLPQAFIAAEDESFYTHNGIAPKAILRAFIKNTMSGTNSEGGSTITQQVVKRLLLTPERTYTRKLKEAILAYKLERYLTKDDILALYLNQIFLGNSAYGVEAASRTYFAKHVQDLSIAESAVIAALPQSPSKVNPFSAPEATIGRQHYVLRRMKESGFITEAQYDEAMAEKLEFKSMYDPSYKLGGWYLAEVQRKLASFLTEENVKDLGLPLDMYGEEALKKGGLHIYTAMDPVHQKAAEVSLRQGLLDSTKRYGWLGAIHNVPADKIGAYLAKAKFEPTELDNAGWARGIVVKVSPKNVEIRLGAYSGIIEAKETEWCRIPNTTISYDAKGQIRTPDKFLHVGDVVWVSAYGAEGNENPVSVPANAAQKISAYDSSKVKVDTPIRLALEQRPSVQGALVSLETESGDVTAIVGGYEFRSENQYNRATQGKRQPGSSFKPIVYSTALDNGYTAASIIDDAPFVSNRMQRGERTLWRPGNVDGQFLGPIILRSALVRSRNLCTIRVAQQLGPDLIIARAKQLGIEGNIPSDLSISLGSHAVSPINMAEAYSAFAGGGRTVTPRLVHRITNRWGQQIVSFAPEKKDAISPQNAYIISSMLKDVIKVNGKHTKGLERIVAGKTGTTNDERDAWFMGYSPFLVTSVYIGFDEPQPMGRFETGSRAAVPVFVRYRKQIEKLYPDVDFMPPAGIRIVAVDADNGRLASATSRAAIRLPFTYGTEPRTVSGAALRRGEDDVSSAVDIFKQ